MDELIVIVGGSGFIGRYLVQELARTGARLRIIVRDPQRALFLKPLGSLGQIQIVAGNVRDPESLRRDFDGATAGVNLAGILAEKGAQSFEGIQASGAANVAQAAAAVGVQAFVQVSAIGADAKSPAAYARSKAAGEAAVRAALPHATILRPSVVFGPEDGFLNRFAGLARVLPVVPVISGGTRFQPVYVLDLARAIAAALADPGTHGGITYEIGGPRTYTMREIIAWIIREIRAGKAMAEMPTAIAKNMARLGSLLPGMPITLDQWLMLQTDNVVTPGFPGLAELGVAATPMEAVAPVWMQRYRIRGRFNRELAA